MNDGRGHKEFVRHAFRAEVGERIQVFLRPTDGGTFGVEFFLGFVGANGKDVRIEAARSREEFRIGDFPGPSPSGLYHLDVFATRFDTGSYEVELIRLRPGAACARELPCGRWSSVDLDAPRRARLLQFEVREHEPVSIQVISIGGSAGFAPRYSIYGEAGVVTGAGQVKGRRDWLELSEGAHVLLVDAASGSGRAELRLDRLQPDSACAPDLCSGEPGSGVLRDPDDIALFRFAGEAGESVNVWTYRAPDQSTLFEFTPGHFVIGPDGRALGGAESERTWRLTQSGTHLVRVQASVDSTKAGAFGLEFLGETGQSCRELDYVAMGDSYSSGEGNPPYLSDTDNAALPNFCHRSTSAYSFSVIDPVRGHGEGLGALSGLDDHPVLQGFDFVACSGSETKNVDIIGRTEFGGPDHDTQLVSGAVSALTDLVTISIAGNDVFFGPLVLECLFSSDCRNERPDSDEDDEEKPVYDACPAGLAPAARTWERCLPAFIETMVGPRTLRAYTAVRAAAPNATVVALGYPLLFSGESGERECDSAAVDFGLVHLVVSRDEQLFARSLAIQLNSVVQRAAADAGVHFVPVAGRFADHELCDAQDEWIHYVRPGFPVTGFGNRLEAASVHPTIAGQRAYADAVNEFLAEASKRPAAALFPSGLPRNPPPRSGGP